MNGVFKKRIDELGRIVIPKELRNRFKIESYDELEMSNDDENILIKKSKSIEIFKNRIDKLVKLSSFNRKFIFIVCDIDKIISSSNDSYSFGNKINTQLLTNSNKMFNCRNSQIFKNCYLSGFVYFDKIIINSNNYGYFFIINSNRFNEDDRLYISLFKDNLINLIS